MAEPKSKQVVIVHYHLRLGGVTRVIETAAKILESDGWKVLVISGEEPEPQCSLKHVKVIEALGYRKTGNSTIAESLTDVLLDTAETFFGAGEILWHFHNTTLGKNVLMPSVICELAKRGKHLLLQIHDFSEEGRANNYTTQRSYFDYEQTFQESLYPIAKHIHYAVINERDFEFLKAAGMSTSNLHYLPNAVIPLPSTAKPDPRPFAEERLFVLYPTRGIRRKNIGELLLLAMLWQDEAEFATSLSPVNPEWQPIYEGWVALAEELGVKINFGICDGGRHRFEDALAWADLMISTSVGEGFGLAFLEPWTVGKGIVGRRLPDVTKGFRRRGMPLNQLYERLEVPVDWIGSDDIKDKIRETLRGSYLAYNQPIPKSAVKTTWKSWVQKGKIDFGVLDEEFQQRVLRHLRDNPGDLEKVDCPVPMIPSAEEISAARSTIDAHFSADEYQRCLALIYARVSHGGTGKIRSLHPNRVLQQFLDPARLNLLKS